MSVSTLPSAMCSAALQYARLGWPVFPCRERADSYQTREGETKQLAAKQPYIAGGLKNATTDEARIRDWWRQHPDALIGLPMGGPTGLFVLDFDPRVEEECDPNTGEVIDRREWTLDQLKADLEAQMGCALPRSVTAITQSGGVHVYLRQPDGEPIRNRGNLPAHVDVRGLGGYVIAPPSVMAETGARYRWIDRGDWRDPAAYAEAPSALVEILRSPKKRVADSERRPAPTRRDHPAGAGKMVDVDDAVRKYALAALDGECRAIREAGSGRRNAQLNQSTFKIATLAAAGAIDPGLARASIEAAARANPGRDDDGQLSATIESGWTAGSEQPRDLAEVAAAVRSRRERAEPRRPARAAPAPASADPTPFRPGSMDRLAELTAEERANVVRVTERWLERRLAQVEPTKRAIEQLAYGIGRRVAAGLLDGNAARERLWAVYESIADVQHHDVDRSMEAGENRGFDLDPLLLTMRCIGHPMTDFGIAERFRDRFGEDYRFTTGKGWLGWDGRRWKVLDQDEKTLPAEVISAVFETVRAIQDEARFMADTGVRRMPEEGEELDLDQPHPHGLDRLIPKGKAVVTLSSMMMAWGRQSETTGKPAAVALLARRWLTVPIERFDHDAYAFNVQNGTLRFRLVDRPDGKREASVELMDHAREDMLTKLSPVEYVPGAACPRYDKMLAWAQPDAPMRRYLHQLGGLSLTGDAGEQKLWFWYGRGRNGKGTTLDVWQHVVGDYADTIPIGSFLDQGVKKRGDQASPDLAKLAGVRMLRSSEPGRNEKLDSGLIKLVTGGDPVPVRMLHRGFFNLQPLFKLIIMGNTRFDIPDTDDGIWSRMKLIPWLRNIEKPEPGVADWPEKDPKLPAKIMAEEAAGVLNRLVGGLLDYMAAGLVEPSSVTEATSSYRDQSDPLARFLRLCVVDDPESRVQSSKLHEVFVAWCKAASEREWSNKGFSNAMLEKGYQKKASDGMQWLGIRLVREVHDFVDADGKPKTLTDDPELPTAAPPRNPAPPDWNDDLPP